MYLQSYKHEKLQFFFLLNMTPGIPNIKNKKIVYYFDLHIQNLCHRYYVIQGVTKIIRQAKTILS